MDIMIDKRKVYLCTGKTDMRKGMNGLAQLVESIASQSEKEEGVFVFRGKQADRIKIFCIDEQGFCMYSKRMEKGKFAWPKNREQGKIGITKAQLSMLMEGIDWRTPR